MSRRRPLWGGAAGIVGLPTVLTGFVILSEQGRDYPWGWLITVIGSLVIIGGACWWFMSSDKDDADGATAFDLEDSFVDAEDTLIEGSDTAFKGKRNRLKLKRTKIKKGPS